MKQLFSNLGGFMKNFLAFFLTFVISSTCIDAHVMGKGGEEKNSHKKFELTLTDAFSRNTVSVASGGISDDGKQVLLGYSQSSPLDTSVPVMELFENSHGTLVSKATLPLDPFILNGGEVNNVAVSRDFKLFATFEDNGGTTGRIRLFKQRGTGFEQINEILFDDVDVATGENLTFTDDNKFIALSYGTTDTTPSQIITTLKILQLSTFEVTSSVTVVGGSNGPKAFRLCPKKTNYVLFGFSGQENGAFAPPAKLQVYKIRDKKLDLVDEVSLPQFPPSYEAFDPTDCCLDTTRIIVGTVLPLLPDQKSVFTNPPTHTFLPGDDNNIREYVFDGHCLHLVTKARTDTAIFVSGFYRDGRTFAIEKGTSRGTVGVPQNVFYASFLTTTGDLKRGKFEPINGVIALQEAFLFQFSGNGKWAIIGAIPFIDGVFNVNLYRVDSNLKSDKKCSKR